jgi:hypothetical protein
MSGIDLIAAERGRQVTAEGWTPAHDDAHGRGELARAAAVYAQCPEYRQRARRFGSDIYYAAGWPFEPEAWSPSPDDRVRELVKAGALVAAEIDRLQRAGAVDV